MNAYKIKNIEPKVIRGNAQKVILIEKKNNSKINISSITHIAEEFSELYEKKYKKDVKFVVRAKNPIGYLTLKGYNEGIDAIEDQADYFDGRVKEKSKFNEYDSVELTFYY